MPKSLKLNIKLKSNTNSKTVLPGYKYHLITHTKKDPEELIETKHINWINFYWKINKQNQGAVSQTLQISHVSDLQRDGPCEIVEIEMEINQFREAGEFPRNWSYQRVVMEIKAGERFQSGHHRRELATIPFPCNDMLATLRLSVQVTPSKLPPHASPSGVQDERTLFSRSRAALISIRALSSEFSQTLCRFTGSNRIRNQEQRETEYPCLIFVFWVLITIDEEES